MGLVPQHHNKKDKDKEKYMVNYMEELSVTEAENLKKTISALFRQTCILQVKYDPVTLTPRDNLHYEICVRHRKFIEDYLSVLGCELVHDPQEHIFRLTGEGNAGRSLLQGRILNQSVRYYSRVRPRRAFGHRYL